MEELFEEEKRSEPGCVLSLPPSVPHERLERGRPTHTRRYTPLAAMPTGVVKFYLEEKGYGFIVPDDESIDVFVHHSGISQGAKGTLAATTSTTSPPP